MSWYNFIFQSPENSFWKEYWKKEFFPTYKYVTYHGDNYEDFNLHLELYKTPEFKKIGRIEISSLVIKKPKVIIIVSSPRGAFGHGEAKCSPNDVWSTTVGMKLALKRAVADLAKNCSK